ncbi:MAG: hypothetical protein ACR65T_09655 [Methylocystis sp.]|uniref:hypothetical protein n=1 Tax=Methylocystis sp. TaxID=1911079 RepID=UPI003DA679F4
MAAKSVPPCDEKIAQAKLLYDSGVTPIGEILELLGMSVGQFRRFREINGWPLRASACAPKKPQEAALVAKKPRDAGRLIARLEDAVEQEFARAEAALAKHAPKTIEASARTLASLVKTLAELKRMRRESEEKKNDADDDSDEAASERDGDAPPRELAELRAELARRLERLRGAGSVE